MFFSGIKFLVHHNCNNNNNKNFNFTPELEITMLWSKAPAKRSQHVNATYRNIVGRNMLCAFGHPVAPCCDMLSVVGSNLTMFKLEPSTPNISQQGGQTRATCCAQQCCDKCCVYMLRSFGWGLKAKIIGVLATPNNLKTARQLVKRLRDI